MGLALPIQKWLDEDDSLYEEPLRDKIEQSLIDVMTIKEGLIGEENMRRLEREVMLHVLDTQWKEHLAAMDYLRQSVGLRGYAQKNPKQEYKREAFELFEDLLDKVKHEAIAFLAKIEVTHNEPGPTDLLDTPSKPMEYKHADAHSALEADDDRIDGADTEAQQQYRRPSKKVGRNDPCPCGSGKKYKQCHGKLD
jgi:preprotein translocase subunit SecA